MSIWADIHRRANGEQIRKEDYFPCEVDCFAVGNGTKLPKKYSALTNIRMQKIVLVFSKTPISPVVWHYLDDHITFKEYVWTYKVGERDVDEFRVLLNGIKEEFGDFTYVVDKDGEAKLSDKSEKMIEEFTKRIKKHNEDVCGVPLRNVSRFEDDWL